MICRIDGSAFRGRVVTLSQPVDAKAAARAVREGSDESGSLSVLARTPHPVHERVGCLRPEMAVRTRTALAEAARARGYRTASDAALERARERLAEFDAADVETADARKDLAAAAAETDRLREHVATIRGRIQERTEHGMDAEPASERLEAAARELSEVETRAAAARQTLDRKRREAREVRDTLEARMRLEDRVANLERRARATLVDRVRDAYAAAVADAPGGPDDPADPFDVDGLTVGMAVARIADFDAPVVVACDRFESGRAASRWLGAPVVQI